VLLKKPVFLKKAILRPQFVTRRPVTEGDSIAQRPQWHPEKFRGALRGQHDGFHGVHLPPPCTQVWWFSFTWRGRRVRQSTKEASYERAKLVASSEMLKLKDKGIDAVLLKAPTLAEFSVEFLQWVESCPREHATKRYYQNGWRLLSETKLAGIPMDTITNTDCEMVKFPGSNYSANTALRTLRRMFSKAKDLRRIAEVPRIELRKEQPRTIAMDETSAALIACRMNGSPKDAFLVLRGTGMRPHEAFRLRWDYFLWDEMLYSNPNGKTRNSCRPIPLLGQSYDVLRRRWLEQGQPREGWVFPSKKAPSGHIETLHKAFHAARTAAGLPKAMCLYTARHGVGTDLAQTFSLKTVMEVLGHADAKTAMRYQHPDVSKMRAQLESARTSGRIN
jgi:integrase